jgi:hypothetical protein
LQRLPRSRAVSIHTLDHVRQVFAAHRLRSTLPRTFAFGWTCTNVAGYRAFLDGGLKWHGILFKDERSATRMDRCMARNGFGSTYLHLRRRNLVIVAKTDLRRRIRAALADL